MAKAVLDELVTAQEFTPFLANLAPPAAVAFLAYVLYLMFMIDVVKARR
jgi:hypothetical protein